MPAGPLKTSTVETTNTHGTGCTLSAAITANLARGQDLFSAVKLAKDYITNALKYALEIGKGQGPVGHFFPLLLNTYSSLQHFGEVGRDALIQGP